MAFTNINKSSDYFNTITWSGDNSTGPITGVGFAADFVWWKQRNGTDSLRLADSVRGEGTNTYKLLFSEGTYTEFNGDDNGGSQGNIDAINSDGYTGVIGTSGYNNWNGTGYNYVSWNWLAGGTGVSNTDGSITSTVSANTTSGFSIVSYTGTGSAATVGHGLGVAPSMIINKCRSAAQNWATYHISLGGTKALFLDNTDAQTTSSSYFNNTDPTSLVFSVGNSGDTNLSSGSQISYCFAEKKGFSKFGSYTGNGSAEGPFVYLGFKPAWLMVKRSDAPEYWNILDTARADVPNANPTDQALYANDSSAEYSETQGIDLVSNGFKVREGGAGWCNASGATYIYMAFANSPFTTSTGIPTTAR